MVGHFRIEISQFLIVALLLAAHSPAMTTKSANTGLSTAQASSRRLGGRKRPGQSSTCYYRYPRIGVGIRRRPQRFWPSLFFGEVSGSRAGRDLGLCNLTMSPYLFSGLGRECVGAGLQSSDELTSVHFDRIVQRTAPSPTCRRGPVRFRYKSRCSLRAQGDAERHQSVPVLGARATRPLSRRGAG